ncbi:beta-propeller fold lactonase family protein [Thalassospira sp. GB04J01]|uniref:lactonase family protein n=1 Tax=Thalassospira sp. GB04J01 TaxID=1485225 RepID=UPI001304D52F|nr:beta-propeller fold lactonase family protein [Thalassospira sp. GB04J01]
MHPTNSTAPNVSGASLLVIGLAGEGALALCELNAQTGDISLLDKVELPDVEGGCAGMPVSVNRAGSRVYAGWRGEKPRVFSFELDRQACSLTCLGQADLPEGVCYAVPASCESRLLSSSYKGSKITISPIDAQGKVGEPVMIKDAQHAHCLVEAPNGFVYATSLRGDFIQTYVFDDTRSSLRPVARREVPSGSGPRHIVFSDDGAVAYLVSEFVGTLTLFDVVAKTGALNPKQTIALLPEGEKAWASEICVTPSGDFLYASERNSSQIFGCRLKANREMERVCAVKAPECPRAFCVDPSGRVLVALGEKSGEAWTYQIGPSGDLDFVSHVNVGVAPSWVAAVS